MESLPPKSPVPVALGPITPEASPPAAPEGSRFKDVLENMAQRIDQGEKLVQRMSVAPGGDDASRLIALQAGIYRYTEAIDLSAKLVDRASSAVKTTLQSQ